MCRPVPRPLQVREGPRLSRAAAGAQGLVAVPLPLSPRWLRAGPQCPGGAVGAVQAGSSHLGARARLHLGPCAARILRDAQARPAEPGAADPEPAHRGCLTLSQQRRSLPGHPSARDPWAQHWTRLIAKRCGETSRRVLAGGAASPLLTYLTRRGARCCGSADLHPHGDACAHPWAGLPIAA